jgi:hypothetical protein
MRVLKRFFCFLFGHYWSKPEDGGPGSYPNCARCGLHVNLWFWRQ